MGKHTKLFSNISSSSIPDGETIAVRDLLGDARLEIKPILGCSRTTLYAAIKDGRIPPPVKSWRPRSKQRGAEPRFLVWRSEQIKNMIAGWESRRAGEL